MLGFHSHVDLHPAAPIPKREVSNVLGDKLGVRHDDLSAVVRPDPARPDSDVPNLPARSANLNVVANLQRLLEQKDQARYEVVEDVLHTETDTDAKSARNDSQLCQFNAGRSEREHESKNDQRVARQRGYRVGHASREPGPRKDRLAGGL